jgi:hypothetical protein
MLTDPWPCSTVSGVAFPAYMSFRALETYDPADEKQVCIREVLFDALFQRD